MPQEPPWPPGVTAPNDPRVYNEDGVDLIQIREMLDKTMAERLQTLQEHANSLMTMRDEIKFC